MNESPDTDPRSQRLAAQLRANLRRRKAQVRVRDDAGADGADDLSKEGGEG